MDVQEMRNKLNSREYNFLKDSNKLGENIILLTTGGSHAYGTNINTQDHISDFDLRGIRLNSKEEILTMNCDDKPFEKHDLDVVIYPLKQIISLLINANPNTIELLGTKDEHLFICTDIGRSIRENVNLFLSKRAYASFGGYATQQLRRLQNALARDSYPQAEKEKHILGSIEKQMMTFSDRYKAICENELQLYVDKSDKEQYEEEIFININLSSFPLRDLKNMYAEMSQVIKDYDKLNHRNSKKDELHLLKHSMHLIRLLKMGTEILEGKGVNTYREYDRELLLDIRNGKYSYEQIFGMVDKLEIDFKYAKDNTYLPDVPDMNKINELVMEINKKVILGDL